MRVKFKAPEQLPDWQTNSKYSLLVFDMAPLLGKWRKFSDAYIAYEDVSLGHKQKFASHISKHEPIGMPIIRLLDDEPFPYKGLVDIYDGRHRTVFLNENGLEAIPAIVPSHQVDAFLAMGLARKATPTEYNAIERRQFFPQPNLVRQGRHC